jgi:hypothetical protein
MQPKHRRAEGLPSATNQHISARIFILTACCGILTFVFISSVDIVGGNQFYKNQYILNA